MYRSPLVTVPEVISRAKPEQAKVRVQYSTRDELRKFSKQLGIMDDLMVCTYLMSFLGCLFTYIYIYIYMIIIIFNGGSIIVPDADVSTVFKILILHIMKTEQLTAPHFKHVGEFQVIHTCLCFMELF